MTRVLGQIPTLPPLLPGSTPTPSPTPEPQPEPSTASPLPSASPTAEVTTAPAESPLPSPSDTAVFVLPTSGPPTQSLTGAPTPAVAPVVPVRAVGTPVSLSGPFGIVSGSLLAVALLLAFLAAQVRPPRRPARHLNGGPVMTANSRWRLPAGITALVASAIVGFVGWSKIADEPALNRQLPLLASAGMAMVLLAVVGGALLVADQMRGDDGRLDELEEAVRSLAVSLAPSIEAPPRTAARRTRSKAAAD